MQTDVVEFRPRFGRWLVVMVAAVAGVGAVSGLVEDAALTVRYLPVLALVVVLVWAAYWRPAVVVSPAGVEIRNVTRTIEIPWPAVQAVTTQYALTLQTVETFSKRLGVGNDGALRLARRHQALQVAQDGVGLRAGLLVLLHQQLQLLAHASVLRAGQAQFGAAVDGA